MFSYAFLPYATALVSVANIFVALRFRRTTAAAPFLGMIVATTLYSLGHAFELASRDLAGAVFWDNAQFLPTLLAPGCVLSFAISYCFPQARQRWLVTLIGILIVVDQAVVWLGPDNLLRRNVRMLSSNGIEYLVYDYGPWLWFLVVLTYLQLLSVVVLLGHRFVFAGRLSRRQIGLVLIGVLVPWVGTVLTVSGAVPFSHPGLDLTPITFTFTNIILSVALFRFRLLDLVPIARERVLEVMVDGVLVTAFPNHELVDWNPAARTMLAPYARRRWEAGTPLTALVPELYALADPGESIDLGDGANQISLVVRRTILRDSDRATRGEVWTVQDVTERIQAYRELEAERRRAEEANAAKSRFIAMISHEIRTPMNAILGSADLLSESPLNQDQHELVRIFRTAGRTLLNMLNDVLDISRIEAGRVTLQPEDFRPAELLADLQGIFQGRAAEAGTTLRFSIAENTPELIRADAQRITQVLSNLMSNAIKFTSQGFIDINLRKPADGRLEFTVEDSGTGIPEDFLQHLFDPFSQAGSDQPREGAGLGLAITKHLVHIMGGEIEARNRTPAEGRSGACFRFTVAYEAPSAVEDQGESEPADAGHSRERAARARRPGKQPVRALIAEDTEVNRVLIERFLKNSSVELTFAHDGREAVDCFEQARFDIVFLDVQMPELDGYAAAREMRRHEVSTGKPRTPILALTAYAMQEERRRALDAGMDDHLTKPIDRKTLEAAIERFVGGPE